MWYAFGWGGGLAKFPGSGVVVKSNCFALDCGFEEFLYRGLSLFFKAQKYVKNTCQFYNLNWVILSYQSTCFVKRSYLQFQLFYLICEIHSRLLRGDVTLITLNFFLLFFLLVTIWYFLLDTDLM